jgi:hypothetical protein
MTESLYLFIALGFTYIVAIASDQSGLGLCLCDTYQELQTLYMMICSLCFLY